jgi:hypothetical protein
MRECGSRRYERWRLRRNKSEGLAWKVSGPTRAVTLKSGKFDSRTWVSICIDNAKVRRPPNLRTKTPGTFGTLGTYSLNAFVIG